MASTYEYIKQWGFNVNLDLLKAAQVVQTVSANVNLIKRTHIHIYKHPHCSSNVY